MRKTQLVIYLCLYIEIFSLIFWVLWLLFSLHYVFKYFEIDELKQHVAKVTSIA